MFPIFFSFSSNSLKAWLFLTEEGRLLYEMSPLKCTQLCPKRNDLAGGKNSLDSFLSQE